MASRKSSDSRPQILEVAPAAAIPGGEFQVRGKNFAGAGRASVTIGAAPAPLVVGSDSYLIVPARGWRRRKSWPKKAHRRCRLKWACKSPTVFIPSPIKRWMAT